MTNTNAFAHTHTHKPEIKVGKGESERQRGHAGRQMSVWDSAEPQSEHFMTVE